MTDLPFLEGLRSFDWIDDVVCVLDEGLRFVFVNAFARRAWGKEAHELLGRTIGDALPFQATPELLQALQQALDTRQRTEFEAFGPRHQAWVNVTVYPQQNHLLVQVRRLPRHLETSGTGEYDALTGAFTRRAFLLAVRTVPLPATLAVVDLNMLKSVNTLRGHTGGDAHIRTVAHALQEALPAGALLCRWGGDEFVILAPGPDEADLRARLDETNAQLPPPVPGTPAFTYGLCVQEAGTPYERAFAVADEQVHLRKETLRGTAASDREAAAFVAFSQELELLQHPDAVIQHALNRLLSLLDFDQAGYAVIEGDEAFFSHHAHREGTPEPQPPLHVRLPLAMTGLVETVTRTGTTAWSTDYASVPNRVPQLVGQGVRSGIVTPVFRQGRVVAALVLRAVDRWQTITPSMRRVAELTALRLEHALEVRRAVRELRGTLEASLQLPGLILEARGAEGPGHTARTTALAARLGAELGLGAPDLVHLRHGASLHDLGKLCLPDGLLVKSGPLGDAEGKALQGHVQTGLALAGRLPGLAPQALEVIGAHHERWDGSGYPEGRRGTEIPFLARIFAVCDVYDTLIHGCPAWSSERARAEIAAQAGQQFDPQVVRVFLALLARPVDG